MDKQHLITIFTIVFASSGFWAFITSLINTYVERHHKKRSSLEEAVMCILHDRVYFLAQHHIKKAHICHGDYDNLQKLYSAYTRLGGNGTAQRLITDVEKIPITED